MGRTALGRWWPVLALLAVLVAVAAWGQQHLPGFGAPIPCDLTPEECRAEAVRERRSADLALRLLLLASAATLLAVLHPAWRRARAHVPHDTPATPVPLRPGHLAATALVPALVGVPMILVAGILGLLMPAWLWVWLTATGLALIVVLDSLHRSRAPHWSPATALLVAWAGVTLPLVLAPVLVLAPLPTEGMWPVALVYALLVLTGPALVLLADRRALSAGGR